MVVGPELILDVGGERGLVAADYFQAALRKKFATGFFVL